MQHVSISQKNKSCSCQGDKTGHAVLVVAPDHALRADLALVLVAVLLQQQQLVPPALEHEPAAEPAARRDG